MSTPTMEEIVRRLDEIHGLCEEVILMGAKATAATGKVEENIDWWLKLGGGLDRADLFGPDEKPRECAQRELSGYNADVWQAQSELSQQSFVRRRTSSTCGGT